MLANCRAWKGPSLGVLGDTLWVLGDRYSLGARDSAPRTCHPCSSGGRKTLNTATRESMAHLCPWAAFWSRLGVTGFGTLFQNAQAPGCWVRLSGCWVILSGLRVIISGCWGILSGWWVRLSGCWVILSRLGATGFGTLFQNAQAPGCWVILSGCWVILSGCWGVLSGCWVYFQVFPSILPVFSSIWTPTKA